MKKLVLSLALIGAANVAFATTTSTTVAPNASAVTALPSGSTSTTAEAAGTKAKKWSATAYASSVLGRVQAAEGDTSKNWGDLYVQATRDIGKGQSIGFRPVWLRNQTLSDRDDEIAFFDPYILYSNKNWYGSTFRTNIPMGEWSRKIGRHEIRHDMGIDLAKFGKFTVSYAQAARVYFYSKEKDGQRSYRWEGDLGLTYTVNDKIAPFIVGKYESNWYNSGNQRGFDMKVNKNPENVRGDYMLELGVGLTPVKGVWIEPSLSYSRDSRRRDAIDLFNDKDTAYELEISISL